MTDFEEAMLHKNAEIGLLRSRLSDVEKVLREMVDKWDIVLPYINAAQSIAHIHGWRYGGPEEGIKPEFDAARALLSDSPVVEPTVQPHSCARCSPDLIGKDAPLDSPVVEHKEGKK